MLIRTLPLLSLLVLPALGQDVHMPGPPLVLVRPERTADNDLDVGFVIDAEVFALDADGGDDGLDLNLRVLELNANAWVDEHTWGYAVLVADEEEVEVDEAAVHYLGLGGDAELRAGRFFANFGTEMQLHLHDLPYPDRPLPLRTYLGEELVGTGVQYDNWFATGDHSGLRFSVGAFADLSGESDDDEGTSFVTDELKDAGDLGFTARVAAVTDLDEHRALQVGASWRGLSEFIAERDGLSADGLSNDVLGLDVLFGSTSADGAQSWRVGAEYLVIDGDLGATPNGPATALDVLDDDASGAYAWVERGWGEGRHALGVLWGTAELPEVDLPSEDELTFYYTRYLSSRSRLRFALTLADSEVSGDSTRFLIQFTNFLGALSHDHGEHVHDH